MKHIYRTRWLLSHVTNLSTKLRAKHRRTSWRIVKALLFH